MRAGRNSGFGCRTFVVALFVVLVATCAMVAPGTSAHGTGTRSCGHVAPPLPAGMHEGYSFFKVTARHLGCGRARRVARRYVELTNHGTTALPVDRTDVFGFDCTVSSTGGLVWCRRGHALVVGHNGGF